MVKKNIQNLRRIIGEVNEVNSSNSQKVVAEAAWGDSNDTVNIRHFNVQDQMLLKGITLTHEEAAQVAYILLADHSIPIDPEKVKDILEVRSSNIVDIAKVVSDGEEPDEDVVVLDDSLDDDEEEDVKEVRTVGVIRLRPSAPSWAKKFMNSNKGSKRK